MKSKPTTNELQAFRQETTYGGKALTNLKGEGAAGLTSSLLASTLLGAGLGGTIGYKKDIPLIKNLLNKNTRAKNAIRGAAYGSLAGLTSGTLLSLAGIIAAGITKSRSRTAQINHDRSLSVGDYIIPGKGIYNSLKRYSIAREDQKRSSLLY